MAKFDVSEAVDELSFDFTKFVPDAKGDIPEPTTDQLTTFRQTVLASIPLKEGRAGDNAIIDFEALKEKVKDDKGAALELELYQAVADLCSNSPTVEQMRALPPRGQQAFIGWIMGTFMRPEALAPATTT